MVTYFNPYQDEHLPPWALPRDINPVARAEDFPDFKDFCALEYQQQIDWLTIAQVAKDSWPDLPAELHRAKDAAKSRKPDILLLQNELVFRAVDAKLTLLRIKDSVEVAEEYWRRRYKPYEQ